MTIDKITITGADDAVGVEDLVRLHEEYPFVEWGILFSKNKEGHARYPSRSKILDFSSAEIPLSAHFCGWHSRSVMEGQNFTLINELPESFKRVQINYNFQRENNWQVKWVIDYAYEHPERAIIFQVNKSNGAAVEVIRAKLRSVNIQFLYDSSGGRGTVIKEIFPPFENYTGYSGGLNPSNIDETLHEIATKKVKDKVWVDMESGVRTENRLDIDKVASVLDACKKYIQ